VAGTAGTCGAVGGAGALAVALAPAPRGGWYAAHGVAMVGA
jgi:hypothetical protein